jgi:hypothetical protein
MLVPFSLGTGLVNTELLVEITEEGAGARLELTRLTARDHR